MEIRVVNYEMVLESYQPYIDGVEKLESYKSDFTKKVESIKSEMEQIVSSSRLLVLDQSTKEKNAMRIRELQAEGMRLESEFRSTISEAQNKILEDCFKDIGSLVSNWAGEMKIDLVLNSNSYIWASDKIDVTSDIIEVIMKRGLHTKDEKITSL